MVGSFEITSTPLISKHEIPAFAEAASRRQAKLETISNDQNPKFKTDD
jgi:hypothetical protein